MTTPSIPKTMPEVMALVDALIDLHRNVFTTGDSKGAYTSEQWQARWAIQNAVAALAAQPAVVAIPEGMAKLGQLIIDQDNRATDAPIFIVQQKRSYVTEDGYHNSRYEWRETESGDYSGPDGDEELARLDKFYSNEGHEPKGWRRFAVTDVWEFVTACFTEQGCKNYLAINGHNLTEPRIYAEGSYRNEEFRAVRNVLIGFSKPLAGQQDISTSMVKCRWEEIKPGLGRFVPIDEFDIAPATSGEATAAQGAATEKEVASLRDQITNLERIKNDLRTRLFKALETEPTLAAALREVDHTPSGSLSRGLYSDVLDIACAHVARVKELEAGDQAPLWLVAKAIKALNETEPEAEITIAVHAWLTEHPEEGATNVHQFKSIVVGAPSPAAPGNGEGGK